MDVDWIHLAQDRDRWRVSCEHSNEPSGPIEDGEFTYHLNDNQLVKVSAAWSQLISFLPP
jgi:hypothetical protein